MEITRYIYTVNKKSNPEDKCRQGYEYPKMVVLLLVLLSNHPKKQTDPNGSNLDHWRIASMMVSL